jgi:hypothetical protein
MGHGGGGSTGITARLTRRGSAECRVTRDRTRGRQVTRGGSGGRRVDWLLTVYFVTPNIFITLWFGFNYGTNPPLGTLII